MNRQNDNLAKLSTLSKDDQEVFKPDYRNWNVLDNKGFKIGRVNDVIVDVHEDKERYLDLELENKDQNHMLLPVGLAKVDKEQNVLISKDLDKETIDKHPEYKGEPITRDYEIEVRSSFLPERATFPEELESDFYNHNHFGEHSLFGIRSTTRSRQIKKGDHQKLNWDRN